jgi:hypothetical protein
MHLEMAEQHDTIETSEQQEQEQRQREEALRAALPNAQTGSQPSYDAQFAGLTQMFMSGGVQQGTFTPQLVEALLESLDREARHNYDYAREQIRSFSKVVYPWMAAQSVKETIAQVIPTLVPVITEQVTRQVTDRLIQQLKQNPSWFQQAVKQSSNSSSNK